MPHSTHRSGRSRALLAALIGGFLAAVVIGVVVRTVAVPLAAITAGAHVVAVVSVSTRRAWETRARIAALSVTPVAIAGSWVWSGPLWTLPSVVVGLLGWFSARTLRRYLRPGAVIPGHIMQIASETITFSDDSVSGIRIGARHDGAVIGISHVSVSGEDVVSHRAVAAFKSDAANARAILSRSGVGSASFICVVDAPDTFHREDDVYIVGVSRLRAAITSIGGPSSDDLVSAAHAAGVSLSREQKRALDAAHSRGAGAKGTGKKIVHKGRVTRVEP